MIQLLGTGGTISIASPVISSFANGTLSRSAGWIATLVVIAGYALFTLSRDRKRRKSGLVAPPIGITWLKIAAAALASIWLLLVTNTNRGIPRFPLNGMALLGLPAAVQLMVTALVLLATITVDVVVRRRGETSR